MKVIKQKKITYAWIKHNTLYIDTSDICFVVNTDITFPINYMCDALYVMHFIRIL